MRDSFNCVCSSLSPGIAAKVSQIYVSIYLTFYIFVIVHPEMDLSMLVVKQ